MVLIVVIALVAVASIFGIGALRRKDSLSDVKRFHQARAMTTGWSQAYRPGAVVRGKGVLPAADPHSDADIDRPSEYGVTVHDLPG
jgi:hypothetical protein